MVEIWKRFCKKLKQGKNCIFFFIFVASSVQIFERSENITHAAKKWQVSLHALEISLLNFHRVVMRIFYCHYLLDRFSHFGKAC